MWQFSHLESILDETNCLLKANQSNDEVDTD
jgi:hypothetical protein